MHYTRFCDPKFIPGRFNRALFGVLERVARGELTRVILNCPPRHGKSTACAVEFPSWILGRNPETNIAISSFSQELSAKEHSLKVIMRVRQNIHHKIIFPDCKPASRWSSPFKWRTSAGGGMIATSVRTPLTGENVDILIIDDPVKDAADARSITAQEAIWAWYAGVAMTRLPKVIIIIMTRWHMNDLSGRLTNEEFVASLKAAGGDAQNFEVISMPAIAEENDWLGREPGEALFPEKPGLGIKDLLSFKAFYGGTQEGRHAWAAMFEQKPTVRGGNYADVTKFAFCDASDLPKLQRHCRYWDLAASDKESADFTAGVKGMMVKGAVLPKGILHPDVNLLQDVLIIQDVTAGQWKWPTARTIISTTAAAEGIEIGVEAQGGFKTAYDNLIEVLPQTIVAREVTVSTGKLERALPWLAMLDRGQVVLVRGPWNGSFISKCERWNPTESNQEDDEIDGTSGLHQMLSTGGGGAFRRVKQDRDDRRVERPERGRVLM